MRIRTQPIVSTLRASLRRPHQPTVVGRMPIATMGSVPARGLTTYPRPMPVTKDLESSPFYAVQSGKSRTIMPTFSSPEEEQKWRKEHLALVFRILHRQKLAEGIAGHASTRDPVDPDTFWVNPQGRSFALMRASDLVRVSSVTGEIVEGDDPVDASATGIHAPVYRLRGRGSGPDAVEGGLEAIVHVHGPHSKAFSALGRELQMLNQDSCAYDGAQKIVTFGGAVFDQNEGARIAGHLDPDIKVAILQNHGIMSLGRLSIDEAAWWQINFEMCCHAQLLVDAALRPGESPAIVSPAELASTKAELAPPEMGWYCLSSYVEEEEHYSQGAHKL